MQPIVSQVCTLSSPFENDIEEYGAAHCGGVEIWLGKLETYLDTHGAEQARRLLDASGLGAPVASYQGGLLARRGEARDEHWRHFGRRLSLCRQLGIGTLVIACDIAGPLEATDGSLVHSSLAEAAALAGGHGVRLALEFQAGAALGNNLETCAALIEHVGSPWLGICLDLFHFHVGPSKLADLALLTAANLFHVQLCDLAGVARELATDADRILPGDGDIPLEPVVARLREIDYCGCVSVELMNPQIWRIAPRNVAEIAITAVRKVLGQAEMQ